MNNIEKTAENCQHSAADPPDTLEAKLEALWAALEALREELKALRLQRSPDGNLEVNEAAELARISRRKLDELIHAGEVPSMKIGRRRLVPRKAFTAWLRSKTDGGRR